MHCQRRQEQGNDGAKYVGSTSRGKEGSVNAVQGMSGPVACQKDVGLMTTLSYAGIVHTACYGKYQL